MEVNMEQFGTLLQGLASLAWPIIFALILLGFRDSIKEVLSSAKSRKFTIKVAGNELTMEEASEQQRALIRDLQTQVADIQRHLKDYAPSVLSSEPSIMEKALHDTVKSILWVDDNPRNNSFLIESLQSGGFEVVLAVSTADALAKFKAGRFDRVISDMGRTESGQHNAIAGLELTRKIREIDGNVPIIIYTTSRAVRAYRVEALSAGANEITASPTVLMNALEFEIS
jgi:CheY-like chemotaxis protein